MIFFNNNSKRTDLVKKKILFIETGIGGGGSWHSLDKIVCDSVFLNFFGSPLDIRIFGDSADRMTACKPATGSCERSLPSHLLWVAQILYISAKSGKTW